MKVIWSPRASNDYLSVLEYLQKEWGDTVVQSFVKRVNDILNVIAMNPQIFIASLKRRDIRRCIVTRHISLYYRQNNEIIELLAFIDNRSDPKNTNI
jgi:plasmid stabilization system protein ParE